MIEGKKTDVLEGFITKIEKSKEFLEQAGFQTIVFEDLMENLLEKLKSIKSGEMNIDEL